MRARTADEITVLTSKYRAVSHRWEVQNASGTWKSLSALSAGGSGPFNFVKGAQYGTDIDAPTWTGTLTLTPARRLASGSDLSISPYVETSPANVDDASAPAPLIEGMRRIRGYETTSMVDGSLASEHKIFDGYVIEWSHRGADLSLSLSDIGHLLVITQIRSERVYDWDGVLLEAAIQQVLDDNLGAGAPTLVVDPSIAGLVTLSSKTKVDRNKLMETVRGLAQNTVGANVRYMWDDDDEMRLRLFMPPRDKVTPDFEFNRGLYVKNPDFKEKTDDIRNVGAIKFRSTTTKSVVSIEYEVPASRLKYKDRYFEFTEDALSQVNTPEEATTLIVTAITDMAQPKAEAQFSGPYCWAADVYDLYNMVANDSQYTSDQKQGAMRIANALGAGGSGGSTQFDTRGNIAGFSRRWTAVEGKGARPVDDNVVTVGGGMGGEGSMFGSELWNGKPDGAVHPFLFIGRSIKRVHIWHRETAPGVAAPLWPPTSSDMYKAVTLERPEGKIPREGNFTWPSGSTLEGTRAWRIVVPLPTTPESTAGVIIQAETFEGVMGPQQRYSATATDAGTLDPGGFASYDVTRIDATTVQVTVLPEVPATGVVIARDGIVIDIVDNASGVEIVWLDEELHADRDYKYQFWNIASNNTGARTTVLIPAWSTSLAFATGTPVALDSPTLGLKVQIGWTGLPPGTDKVQIQKSRDSGHYDPWSVAATVNPSPALYYDAVVVAGQFYRLVALAAGGAVLDRSLPVYWTNPFG